MRQGAGARPRSGKAARGEYMRRRVTLVPDRNGDPMEALTNLFDVAMLIGLGMLVMALGSFGLGDLLASEDVTIVKDPGQEGMELIIKEDGRIERFSDADENAQGLGSAIGTVYRLDSGEVVWVPAEEGTD